jgi:hypothetical protein
MFPTTINGLANSMQITMDKQHKFYLCNISYIITSLELKLYNDEQLHNCYIILPLAQYNTLETRNIWMFYVNFGNILNVHLYSVTGQLTSGSGFNVKHMVVLHNALCTVVGL